MGLGTALALMVVLVGSADARGELGLKAEASTSTLAMEGFDSRTRAGYSVTPRAAVLLDAWRLRLDGAYGPRIWTSDVEAAASPSVTHGAQLALRTRHDSPWNAAVTANAVHGWTDPLADPYHAITATGPNQEPTTEPLGYETLVATARGDVAFGPRTSTAVSAAWSVSRATEAASRVILPTQRGITLDLSGTRAETERDTLGVTASARSVETWRADGRAQSAFAAASASFSRRLSATVNARAAGGAALGRQEDPGRPAEGRWVPSVEASLARQAEGRTLALDGAVRVAPFVDRFTGGLSTMAECSAALRWSASAVVTVRVRASAGARTDGETALGQAAAGATWRLGERLGVEAGVVARWQRDRRDEVPSYLEGGVVVAVVYETRVP